MSDVLMFQTQDGANVNSVNGILELTDGPETAFYLSLVGGNLDDPGVGDSSKQWWANAYLTDPAKKYRSQTQYLLRNFPLTSATLPRIQAAVLADLQWSVDIGLVPENRVTVSVPRLNHVNIRIENEIDTFNFPFQITRLEI